MLFVLDLHINKFSNIAQKFTRISLRVKMAQNTPKKQKKNYKETLVSYSSVHDHYTSLEACINKSSEGTRVILVCDPLEVEVG